MSDNSMKILIVDDSTNKIKDIYNVLLTFDCITESNIDYCNDVMNAKTRLRLNKYDLLILDVNMPEEITSDSSEQSGFAFIDEIIKTDLFMTPSDICILTEYDNLKDEYIAKKLDYYFPIITYSATSKEWENRLKARVDYMIKCHNNFSNKKMNFDIALITAVQVETNAIKKAFGNWEKFNVLNDPTIYHATFLNKGERSLSIVLAEQATMGMVSAAALSTKMLINFNPKYLIMSGIAAGIGRYNYGDILFPKYVYDYSSGKYITEGENHDLIGFEPDPKYCSLNQSIFEKSKQDFSDVLYNIKKNYEGEKPTGDLMLIPDGLFACGSSVVANKEYIDKMIRPHSRKITGLDMESYGVFFACECLNSVCKPICIKSICDFANSEKSDDYQKYAAYTSANFVKYFIEKELDI